MLVLLFQFWQPMPEVVWSVDQPFLRLALNAAFWSGWTIVLVAALLTNSLELVGLRQIWDWCVGREDSVPTLTTSRLSGSSATRSIWLIDFASRRPPT